MPVKHVRSASGFEVKGDMSGFGFPDRRDNAVAGEPYIQTILFADQNPCVFPFRDDGCGFRKEERFVQNFFCFL